MYRRFASFKQILVLCLNFLVLSSYIFHCLKIFLDKFQQYHQLIIIHLKSHDRFVKSFMTMIKLFSP